MEKSARLLPYLDLARAPTSGALPVVYEQQHQPCAYIFDARHGDRESHVTSWIRRIAFRGDAEWVGVLRPGSLDLYEASLESREEQPEARRFPAGPFLMPSIVHLKGSDRPGIRKALVLLLRRSIDAISAAKVPERDALSLVGRALFWRFLIDRGLLEGMNPYHVCPGAKSWESCMDNKANALTTFAWLESTFNGGFLPFTTPRVAASLRAEIYSGAIGNIAHAATADGQLQLRIPNDWREINFAHVPVGLLSEVYEAYSHSLQSEKAKTESIFYTPKHIAEFVVAETLGAVDSMPRPRVLDPAAGAGVFLVAAFRYLVAREWERTGVQPSRSYVRRVLNTQLVGFDINEDALGLCELSLYLTAIELDPDERPRPLALLKFQSLRNSVLFVQPGGIAEGSLGPVAERFRAFVDAVVGNPPWTAKVPAFVKKHWVRNTSSDVLSLLGDRAEKFDFPDTNPDLPFVYRAMEWLRPDGVLGLVTHARWLFSQSAPGLNARRDLLSVLTVTGILNGAALRRSGVWPNVKHPFCLLFASNRKPSPDAVLQFVSPQLQVSPDAAHRQLQVDWQDGEELAASEIVSQPWTLKVRFRGSSFDESVLEAVHRRGIALGLYLETIGTELRNGYQIGGDARAHQSAEHLLGLPDIHGVRPGFVVNLSELDIFSRREILYPRGREVYKGPLLLILESMRVDASMPRSTLSFSDVAFDERYDGASFLGISDGLDQAAYLQVVIQSSLFTHSLLFLDGQYGVEREVVHKKTIERVPVIPWQELSLPQRRYSTRISARLHAGATVDVLADIDKFVFDLFGLSDVQRQTVLDTVKVALPTTEAKIESTRLTDARERLEFCEICASELSDILDRPVLIREVLQDCASPWRFMLVTAVGAASETTLPDLATVALAAGDASVSLVTIHVARGVLMVFLLDQFRFWTQTRARLLAAALTAEVAGDW